MLGGLVLVLVVANAAVIDRERVIVSGTPVLLELAPVDPRSLIQGDYMALRFTIVSQIEERDPGGDKASVNVDERGVATLSTDGRGSLKLRYRMRGSQAWLGTNAYFFEEGSAARYDKARFGEFRVDRDTGEAVIVGLRDSALAPL